MINDLAAIAAVVVLVAVGTFLAVIVRKIRNDTGGKS